MAWFICLTEDYLLPYELFNAEIWLICKCLIINIKFL